MNPFTYHGPVLGPALCGREDVLDALLVSARAGRVAAVAGPAGHGVSSLALEVADRLRSVGTDPVLVGLAGLADGNDLAHRLPPSPGRDAAEARDPVQRPLLVDDADRSAADGAAPDSGMRLRGAAGGSGLLLFGHDAGALEQLLDPGEEPLEIGPLPLAAWLPYALERFLETDVWVANEHVEAAHRLVAGHPRRLQHLSHEIWDLAGGRGRRVEDAMLEEGLERVAGREARTWTVTWTTLTPNQRRFLRAVARGGGEAHPFGRDFLSEAGLTTASSAQRAAASLRDRGLLDEVGGALRVADPLLARWLSVGA